MSIKKMRMILNRPSNDHWERETSITDKPIVSDVKHDDVASIIEF